MANVYVDLIRAKRMTLDQVPIKWRAEVENLLNGNTDKEEK